MFMHCPHVIYSVAHQVFDKMLKWHFGIILDSNEFQILEFTLIELVYRVWIIGLCVLHTLSPLCLTMPCTCITMHNTCTPDAHTCTVVILFLHFIDDYMVLALIPCSCDTVLFFLKVCAYFYGLTWHLSSLCSCFVFCTCFLCFVFICANVSH